MSRNKRSIRAGGILVVMIMCNTGLAQEAAIPSPSEMRPEVTELTAFHAVIYKMWHTAWPKKNLAMLRELLPEVQERGEALVRAELPGILREKKTVWRENVEKMKAALDEYRTCVSDTNGGRLLDAAENLHSQYEKLVRVIRPVLKELDDFHAALYPLYHYYLPQRNMEGIRGSVVHLKEKMASLAKARLPERLKDREESFAVSITRLSEAVDRLSASLSSSNESDIEKNVNILHTRFEEAGRVLE